MTLQEKIDAAKPYLKLFNISLEDDAISAVLDLPKGWLVPDDESLRSNYGVIKRTGPNNIQYFFTEVNNGYDRLFDCIEYILTTNQEVEKIKDLFKVKAAELKKLFNEKTYDELLGLEFTFKPVKKPSGKRKPAKPVEDKTVVEKLEEISKPEPKKKEIIVDEEPEPAPPADGNDLLAFAESMTGGK